MKNKFTFNPQDTTHYQQKGVALLTVLIILLLTSILVLSSFRLGFLNEILVGTESDHSRAKAAAEILLRDAEMDIRGRRLPYDTLQSNYHRGLPCVPKENNAKTLIVEDNYRIFTDNDQMGGCRARQIAKTPYIPSIPYEYDDVKARVLVNQTENDTPFPCSQGICTPNTLNQLDNFYVGLSDKMKDQGAVYGEFTRQSLDVLDADSNVLLRKTEPGLTANSKAKGWYWIEIFPMLTNKDAESVLAPGAAADPRSKLTPVAGQELAYRITAVVFGRKNGTRVVLRSMFVPHPKYQN